MKVVGLHLTLGNTMSKRVRKCASCAVAISEERLEVLPLTRVCVKCSREKPLSVQDVDIASADSSDLQHSFQQSGGER